MQQRFDKEKFHKGMTLAVVMSLQMVPDNETAIVQSTHVAGLWYGLNYMTGILCLTKEILHDLFDRNDIEDLHTASIDPNAEKYGIEAQLKNESLFVPSFTGDVDERHVFDQALMTGQHFMASVLCNTQDDADFRDLKQSIRTIGIARDLLSNGFDRGVVGKDVIMAAALALGEGLIGLRNKMNPDTLQAKSYEVVQRPADDYVRHKRVSEYREQIGLGHSEHDLKMENRANTLWMNKKYNTRQWEPPGVN